MKRQLARSRCFFYGLILSLLFVPGITGISRAQAPLHVMNAPKGGRMVYGPIPGETTEAGAMGWMLSSWHKEFGDRPQVGKLFQVRGTQSVAAFFSFTNRTHGDLVWNGLMIVTKTATDRVEGGAVLDAATNISNSFNPMMKALLNAWHPFAGNGAGGIPPLHKFTARDNSASVDLPDGWKAQGNGGTIGADGPNGERVMLDLASGGMDTQSRAAQGIMRQVQQGGLRNTAYAKAYYYPRNGDLGKMFVDTLQRLRRQSNLPDAEIHVDSLTNVPAGQSRCAHIVAHLTPPDSKDDRDKRELNAVMCVGPTANYGGYSITLFYTGVSVPLADHERAMLAAILGSFQINMAVVNKEAHDYAAPAIERIHQIGINAANQAQAQHEANDIHNSSVYQKWDSDDKRNQAFGNYLLDQSVVRDVGNNEHQTLWNSDAQRLIEQYPNSFEYVPTSGYWKGVDY